MAAAAGFVDCHCHMTAEEFLQDAEEILERSRKEGVQALVSVTENTGEFKRLIRLSERYPKYLMPCFGVHPIQRDTDGYHSVTMKDLEPALSQFAEYRDHLVAVGEVRHHTWDQACSSYRHADKYTAAGWAGFHPLAGPHLRRQRGAAEGSTDTTGHRKTPGPARLRRKSCCIILLDAHQLPWRGCRPGTSSPSPPLWQKIIREKLIRQIPLENICLETDSPALGPDVQERNIPSNIHIPCEYVARVKGLSPETVRQATTHNALRLFERIRHKMNQ